MVAIQSTCSFICCSRIECGRKRIGVANNDQKVAPWNQEVKDASSKKVAYWAASDPDSGGPVAPLTARGLSKKMHLNAC